MRVTERWGGALLAALLASVGLVLVAPALGHPFFYDDLHWFRDYSFAEIWSTWTGTNDPDGLEIPGYRPLHALTNYGLFLAFGENPGAYRILSVLVLAGGLTLLAGAVRAVGVDWRIAAAAALLTLTAKNLTFLYVWPSAAYHALQVLTFGGTLYLSSTAFGDGGPRRGRLAASVALWAVSAMIADVGLVLLGIVIGWAVLAASGGLPALAEQVGAPSFRTAAAVIWRRVREVWRIPALRWYLAAVVLVALLLTAGRFYFVPEARPGVYSPLYYLRTLRIGVSLAGDETTAYAVAYVTLAVLVIAGLLLAPRLTHDARVTVPWMAGLLALMAMATASVFGLETYRVDITNFPLFFYCVALCSAVAAAHRALGARVRGRLVMAVAALALVSLAFSVSEGLRMQQAFSRWSVQRLIYDYTYIYEVVPAPTIPPERRARVVADLRAVGVNGRWRDRGNLFELQEALATYLYCRKQREPDFLAEIPSRFAWGKDAGIPTSAKKLCAPE